MSNFFSIKSVIIVIFLIGLILIIIDLTKMNTKCSTKDVIYKYIPRTFEEEQNNPVFIDEIFGSMFKNKSPWVGSFTNTDTIHKDDLSQT